MKKIIFLFMIQASLLITAQAQVLNVNNNEQKHDQWCWAACSKTMLDYYGFVKQQCDIAEWTRTTATFYNFGNANCCTDATKGCNYWNYNYGEKGSIQEILVHFGNIQNTGIATALTQAEVVTELQNNRLFVIRWGWSTGGGHFIVGHGISGNNVYFMNPWFGEGLHIGTYNFMKSGVDGTSTATHTWTHTNKITSNMTGIQDQLHESGIRVYPNPSNGLFTLAPEKNDKYKLEVLNYLGQPLIIRNIEDETGIDMGSFDKGIYLLKVTGRTTTSMQKIIIQ